MSSAAKQRVVASASAVVCAAMLAVWLTSFPDLRGPRLGAVLVVLSLPYLAILWFLRTRVTRVGIALAAGTAAFVLLLSPVFAIYLFGSAIGAIGMPLPMAGLGTLIVIGHAVLLLCAIAMGRDAPQPRRPLVGYTFFALVGMTLYVFWSSVVIRLMT